MSDLSKSPVAAREPLALRVVDGLGYVLAIVAAVALVLLAANVLVDVIGRALFNTPLRGTLEMTTQWWMPILTLLAFAYTERRQEHIKVTILLDTLPPRLRQVIEGTFGLIATGLLVALCWHSLTEALESAGYKQATSSVPPVAIWPFKFVAVVGVGALALQSAVTAFRYFAGYLPRSENLQSDGDIV